MAKLCSLVMNEKRKDIDWIKRQQKSELDAEGKKVVRRNKQ